MNRKYLAYLIRGEMLASRYAKAPSFWEIYSPLFRGTIRIPLRACSIVPSLSFRTVESVPTYPCRSMLNSGNDTGCSRVYYTTINGTPRCCVLNVGIQFSARFSNVSGLAMENVKMATEERRDLGNLSQSAKEFSWEVGQLKLYSRDLREVWKLFDAWCIVQMAFVISFGSRCQSASVPYYLRI